MGVKEPKRIGNQTPKTTTHTNWSRRRAAPSRRQAGPECGRGPEGAGQKADAMCGLQVPECVAAPIRPPRSLKGSNNHSRRVAEAFALPPRLGGRRSGLGSRLSGLQASAAPRGAPIQPSRLGAFLSRRPCPRAPRLGPQRPRCRGMDRAALRAAAMGEKKEGGGGGAAADGRAGAAASRALQQCVQLQKLIDISIGSLRGLRTKCSVSNDLTQQEIRTLEVRGRCAPRPDPAVAREPPHCFPSRVASCSGVAGWSLPPLPELADAAA